MGDWPDPQISASFVSAKEQLIQMLKEYPAIDESKVTWGKGPLDVGRTQIAVGDVRAKQTTSNFGSGRREEVMQMTVTVTASGAALDGVEPLTRAVGEIEGHIAAALRKGPGDPTLRSRVRTALIVEEDLKELEQGDQFEARLTLKIETRNRI